MTLYRKAISLILVGIGTGVIGCATGPNGKTSKAPTGAVIGSLAGAGLGAIIGHQSGETGAGAAIGAAVGGAGGYVIGNEQDKTETNQQVAATQAQANAAYASANTVVVNVKNSNGSVTPVTLNRVGNEYVGPKGEHYLGVPTEEQLRPVYGF